MDLFLLCRNFIVGVLALITGTGILKLAHHFAPVNFTNVVDKYPIHGIVAYACYGKVTEKFGHLSLEANWIRKVSLRADPRVSDPPTLRMYRIFGGKGLKGIGRWFNYFV